MAKKKNENPDMADDKKPVKVGYKSHRAKLEAAGLTLVHDSRPRNKPYTIEEWLTPARGFKLLKVFDSGTVVSYSEDAKFDDDSAAADSLR